VYGKCTYDVSATRVQATIYIKTSADRSIFDSAGQGNALPGGPAASFLNTDTPETSRLVYVSSNITEVDGEATLYTYDYGQWIAVAPDGFTVRGNSAVGEKRGTLVGGNGPWPEGNACFFSQSAEQI
jgi:hypothetical protein